MGTETVQTSGICKWNQLRSPIRWYNGDLRDFLYVTPASIEYIRNLDIKYTACTYAIL